MHNYLAMGCSVRYKRGEFIYSVAYSVRIPTIYRNLKLRTYVNNFSVTITFNCTIDLKKKEKKKEDIALVVHTHSVVASWLWDTWSAATNHRKRMNRGIARIGEYEQRMSMRLIKVNIECVRFSFVAYSPT